MWHSYYFRVALKWLRPQQKLLSYLLSTTLDRYEDSMFTYTTSSHTYIIGDKPPRLQPFIARTKTPLLYFRWVADVSRIIIATLWAKHQEVNRGCCWREKHPVVLRLQNIPAGIRTSYQMKSWKEGLRLQNNYLIIILSVTPMVRWMG